MRNIQSTSHAKYDLKVHLVWCPKYRKRVLHWMTANNLHKIIKEICKKHDIRIISGKLAVDHVHLFVSYDPSLSISKLVQYIKWESAMRIMELMPEIRKQYWWQRFWWRWYLAVSSWSITDEIIQEYIDNQDGTEIDDNFTVEP